MTLREELEALKLKQQETHDAVIGLCAKFNGGPGSWAPCAEHRRTLDDHEARLREQNRPITMALGIVGFVSFVGVVAGIYAIFKH